MSEKLSPKKLVQIAKNIERDDETGKTTITLSPYATKKDIELLQNNFPSAKIVESPSLEKPEINNEADLKAYVNKELSESDNVLYVPYKNVDLVFVQPNMNQSAVIYTYNADETRTVIGEFNGKDITTLTGQSFEEIIKDNQPVRNSELNTEEELKNYINENINDKNPTEAISYKGVDLICQKNDLSDVVFIYENDNGNIGDLKGAFLGDEIDSTVAGKTFDEAINDLAENMTNTNEYNIGEDNNDR